MLSDVRARAVLFIALGCVLSCMPVDASATPDLVAFQAYLTEDHDGTPETPEVPVNGIRRIKFSLWTSETLAGGPYFVWSEEQDVNVDNGSMSALLGTAFTIGGVTTGPMSSGLFTGPDLWLEIHDLSRPAPMSPRLRLAAAPYAMVVDTINSASGGVVTGDVMIDGVLRADGLQLQSLSDVSGYVLTADAAGNASWQPAPTGSGAANSATELFEVKTLNLVTGGSPLVKLRAQTPTGLGTGGGSSVTLSHADDPDQIRASLQSGTSSGGGALDLYRNGTVNVWNDQSVSVFDLESKTSDNFHPLLLMRDRWGNTKFRFRYSSDNNDGYPELSLFQNATEIVEVGGTLANGAHLFLRAQDSSGGLFEAISMVADAGDGGGTISVQDRNGEARVIIDGDQDSNPGTGRIRLRGADPNTGNIVDTIVLNSTSGRVTAKEIAVTGMDLAERFEVVGDVEPGVVVSLDALEPGRLRVSDEAYDTLVAGVVSGANGIEPGLILGKDEATADGKTAIALAGRVYVKADASGASIRVGDLLTTSERAGHVMRAEDRERAFGAIVGKAMSSLDRGQGYVLVLIGIQ